MIQTVTHITCDHFFEACESEISGSTREDALLTATEEGWLIVDNGGEYCPYHRGFYTVTPDGVRLATQVGKR